MNRLLFLLCCICVPWMARGQAAYEWLYWFDMNHASRVSGQSIGDSFTITTDADGLSEGIHTIHVQVADTAGKYSPPLGQLFYYSSGRAVKRLYYWFDNEVALTQTVPVPLNDLSIDVSGLEPGLHFIYCQVEDAAGILSDVMCRGHYGSYAYKEWEREGTAPVMEEGDDAVLAQGTVDYIGFSYYMRCHSFGHYDHDVHQSSADRRRGRHDLYLYC